MGFFVPDEDLDRLTKRKPITPKPAKERRQLDPALRGCDHCSLRHEWRFINSPQMRISGNTRDPDILILGEAPGCVAGSTRIEVAYRDRSKQPEGIPIKDLVGKSNFFVYSYDVNKHSLALGLVKRVWKTGRKQTFRVTYEWKFAKGKETIYLTDSVIVTANHPFLLKRYIKHDPFAGIPENQDYCCIDDGLRAGHSLQPFYQQMLNPGYISVGTSHKDLTLESRLLLGAKEGCALTAQEDAHHLDENTLNNSWDNLERLTKSLHTTKHLLQRNPMHNPKHRRAHKKAVTKPGYRQLMSQRMTSYLADNPEAMAARVTQFLEAGKATRFPPRDNHKVVKIEPWGVRDVYDMEVEKYHNFAAHGIFLHNNEEDYADKAFVGESGKMIRRVIPGRELSRCAFQNVVRCFPGDTQIGSLGVIKKAFKRWYEGPLARVTTRQGRRLSGSLNHPILMTDGWSALGSLKEGDNLFCHRGAIQRASGVYPDVKQMPSLEEVYRSCLELGDMTRMIGRLMNLYGEIPNNDVDVVSLPGPLVDWMQTSLLQRGNKRQLQRGSESSGCLHCAGFAFPSSWQSKGLSSQLVTAFASATNTSDADLFRAVVAVPSDGCFGAGPGWNPFSMEERNNCLCGNAFDASEFFRACSFQIQGDYLTTLRDPVGMPATLQAYAGGFKSFTDSMGTDPRSVLDFYGVQSLPMEIDEVVHSEITHYSGHLYTLETTEGAYIANGIIVGNCRPQDNATPSPADAHACSIHLEDDVADFDFRAILGVGSVPLARYLPGQAITRVHGCHFPVQIGDRVMWYMPVLHPSFVLRSGGDSGPHFPHLRADTKRLFEGLDSWGKPQIIRPDPDDCLYPSSYNDVLAILEAMDPLCPLGLDIETTGLYFAHRNAEVLTAAISDGTITMAWPIQHPEGRTDWGLRALLHIAANCEWVAHNATFELVWLIDQAQRAGIAFKSAPFHDSMACGRIYYQRATVNSLEVMSKLALGSDFKAPFNLNMNRMAEEPLDRVLPYNGLDAQASALIWRKLRPLVDDRHYERIIETIESCVGMQLLGLPIDRDLNDDLAKHWQAKIDAANKAAQTIYEVKQFQRERQAEFNIGSNKDVGIALSEYGRVRLEKMTSGQLKTDDQELRLKAPDHPLVPIIVDYREATKAKSTYIDSPRKLADLAIDGNIHPIYNAMKVETTRLSSEMPNQQNWPKRNAEQAPMRAQVIPPPGMVFLSFDYGQIEARIFGMASKDRSLCQSIIDEVDIHSKWLQRALDMYPQYWDNLIKRTNETEDKKIFKSGRDIIKSDFVFASFFGSTAEACSDRTGIPLHITRDLLAEFWREYPDGLKYVKAKASEYENTGSVSLLTGFVRRSIMDGNEFINTPVQGTATGHLVVEAQNDCAKLSRETGDICLHPRMNIHDDLTFIVPDNPDQILGYIDQLAPILLKVRYDWQIVPLMIEARIGYNFKDYEEITKITGDYIDAGFGQRR